VLDSLKYAPSGICASASSNLETLFKRDLWDSLNFYSETLLMSSILVKRRPFMVPFIFENRKKTHGTMSGGYRGWGIFTVLFVAEKFTIKQ